MADGREALAPGAATIAEPRTLESLCRALLSGRGEASGVALARQVLDLYAARRCRPGSTSSACSPATSARPGRLRAAWERLRAGPAAPAGLRALLERRRAAAPGAVPPPQPRPRRHGGPRRDARGSARARRRRPGPRKRRRRLRAPLLLLVQPRLPGAAPRSTGRRPADILEQIIRYEAVHAIQGWDDLRRRVQPPDRRCFAFFHPSLIDEPLIFVEVALTREIPALDPGAPGRGARGPAGRARPTTAVFYSISNCQPGLRGVSFGNFLIKQVVEELSRELPSLDDLRHPLAGAGLRPLARPGRRGPRRRRPRRHRHGGARRAAHARLARATPRAERLRPLLLGLAAAYYLRAKGARREAARPGGPLPPRQRRPPRAPQLARRHLGQGPARGRRADGQLPLRPALDRGQPRGLRQRRHGRRRGRRRAPPARPRSGEHVPGDRRMSENLFETFRRSFPADPAAAFLERPDGSVLSYADLLDLSGRIANALARAGREARRPRRGPGREERRGAAALSRRACAPARVYLPLNTAYTAGEVDYFLATPSRPSSSAGPSSQSQMRSARRRARRAAGRDPRRGRRRQPLERTQAAVAADFADVPRDARRPRRHPLHLGHDRALEGRHAQPRQPRLERRGPARGLALHAPTTCCCTRCRSSTPTACSSPPTSRCWPAAR